MSRRRVKRPAAPAPQPVLAKAAPSPPAVVPSLLAQMRDGSELGSIIDKVPAPGIDLLNEVVMGLREIENVRQRPCIAYIGNVSNGDALAAIDYSDDLPFAELVASVPAAEKKVDVFLSTLGGSAQQVSRFVNALRARFDEVDVLVPSFCMSAGTLFALSGDHIWMTPMACLGPIDPQVPSRDGRYVPAQALVLLVDKLQRDGADAMQKGQPVPWTAVRIIDSMDKKELGEAITASNYSIVMAKQFLVQYKFQHWVTRKDTGIPVDQAYREARAEKIAADLASHDRWKSHGHAIPREVLWTEIRLEIDHPDAALERAMRRLWALCAWLFDKSPVVKIMASQNYRFVRNRLAQQVNK